MAQRAKRENWSGLGLLPTIVLVVGIMYVTRDILIPISVAVLLAFVLEPAVRFLERRGIWRTIAITLVMLVTLAGLWGMSIIIEREVVDIASKLPDYRENITRKMNKLRGGYEHAVRVVTRQVNAIQVAAEPSATSQPTTAPTTSPASTVSLKPLNPEPPALPKFIGEYSGFVLSPLADAAFILIAVVCLLLNHVDIRDRLLRLAGHGRLHITTQAMDEATSRITSYLQTQAIINLVYGICIGIGLWVIGKLSNEGAFPDVLLWAMFGTLFRFMPYVGPWIGAAMPLVLSLVLFDHIAIFAATLGLYVGLELLTGNVLEPLLYGSSTGLSPLAVLGSAIFWTWLWGPVGLLLSTPLTVCLVVLGKYVSQLNFLRVLLGDEKALDPHHRVYQRLLSRDRVEATALAVQYFKEHDIETTFMDVLIPVLARVEMDRSESAIEEDRASFVWESMRLIVAELAKAELEKSSAVAIPLEDGIEVFCLPAFGEADEIAGLMLSHLLKKMGRNAVVPSHSTLTGEIIEMLQQNDSAIVCISALPPSAIRNARRLHKRLRARFPELHTVLGLWSIRSRRRWRHHRRVLDHRLRFVFDLHSAVVRIQEMSQSLKLKASQHQ